MELNSESTCRSYVFVVGTSIIIFTLLIQARAEDKVVKNKTSAEEELSVALLIVELLKTRYANLIKNNTLNGKNSTQNGDAGASAFTTPPTTPLPPLLSAYPPATVPAQRLRGLRRRAFKPARRFLNQNDYLYYEPRLYYEDYIEAAGRRRGWWRRKIDYDEPYYKLPEETTTTIASTTETAASDDTTSTSTPALSTHHVTSRKTQEPVSIATAKKSKTVRKRKNKTAAPGVGRTIFPTKAAESLRHIKKNSRAAKSTTDNVILSQVVAEVVQEMADIKSNGTFKSGLRSRLQDSKNSTNQTMSINTKVTMRIHMANSKRYSIPLPENNAFCFKSPDNPLCRTFI